MKDAENTNRLVLFYVKLPFALNIDIDSLPPEAAVFFSKYNYDFLDKPLNEHCEGHFFKLGRGAYLLDENPCYPAIIQMMNLCNGQQLPHVILPLSDFPLSLSPPYQGSPELLKFLKEADKRFRLTGFPPPQPRNKPAPSPTQNRSQS